MRCFILAMGMGTMLVIAAGAQAQDEGQRPRRDGEMRQRMIDEFDADGDGELSDEERQTARETMRERRGDDQDRRGQGRRAQDRPAPPDPNELFDEFDTDKDGQLSRDEFTKFIESRPGRRGPRRPREEGDFGAQGPPRAEERPPAPPRGRRDFGPRPPLPNQIDGLQGPPPEFGPPPAEAGLPEGPRGPRGRGPEGFGGPDPNRLFDRFDENGDDQLSREEFTNLTERLRDMRGRFGPGPPRGDRGPRGPGLGRGERGGPEGDRPRRPPRPEAQESDPSASGEETDPSSV